MLQVHLILALLCMVAKFTEMRYKLTEMLYYCKVHPCYYNKDEQGQSVRGFYKVTWRFLLDWKSFNITHEFLSVESHCVIQGIYPVT